MVTPLNDMAAKTDGHECTMEYTDHEYSSISEFLQLSDLLMFKEKFVGAGITKVEHLQDVEEEDLKEFGKIFILTYE